jgi:hypothetical protein
MRSQRIQLSSLPDNQQIRLTGGVITTVAKMKLEMQRKIAAAEVKSRTTRTQIIANFNAYKAKFTSSQVQARNTFELAKTELVKVASLATRTNAQVGAIPKPPTPVIANLDRNEGQCGESFLITGSNFLDVTDAGIKWVMILVSADTWMNAGIAFWSSTQIVATVPDISGHPSYDGFVLVQTRDGKSNLLRFRVIGQQDVLLLSGKNATTVLGNCSDDTHTGCAKSDTCLTASHSENILSGNCDRKDYLWQNLRLKSGWKVDTVVLTKNSEGDDGHMSLDNNPLGTEFPELQISWHLDWGVDPYLNYTAAVYLVGPKGVPYQ